ISMTRTTGGESTGGWFGGGACWTPAMNVNNATAIIGRYGSDDGRVTTSPQSREKVLRPAIDHRVVDQAHRVHGQLPRIGRARDDELTTPWIERERLRDRHATRVLECDAER